MKTRHIKIGQRYVYSSILDDIVCVVTARHVDPKSLVCTFDLQADNGDIHPNVPASKLFPVVG